MENWKSGELGNFITLKRGFDLPQQKRETGRVPVFSSSGITGVHSQAMVKAPGVITGRCGTIGEVFFSAEDFWPLNTTLFVEDFHGNDEKFIYYFLKTVPWSAFTAASAVPGINRNTVHKETVRLPELQTQKKIAAALSLLDEKIRTNAKINENLEQQIEAIFNNKYAPSLCCPNWNVGTIGDVVTLQRGYDLPKDKMVPGSYPVAGSTDTIFYHNDYTTEAPCVVMGRSGNIGKPRLYMERCWAHNTTLFVKDFKGNNPYWSYYMLRSIDYSQFRGGSAVPTLNRNHVHSFEFSIPPVNQQNEFGEIILPILLLIENNRKEIKRLSTLREALLPKLMAGEIDISDIAL